LGCSPLPTHAYHEPASPGVYNVTTFGVGQGTEEFLPLNPQSVSLPLLRSRPRLDYGQLWKEPAITCLDWLFTPNPRSQEHLLVAPLQASTMCYHHFTLPRIRSTGFGSYTCDSKALSHLAPRKLRALGFPSGTSFRFTLATHIHSLARYSKRTTQPLRAVSIYNY